MSYDGYVTPIFMFKVQEVWLVVLELPVKHFERERILHVFLEKTKKKQFLTFYLQTNHLTIYARRLNSRLKMMYGFCTIVDNIILI